MVSIPEPQNSIAALIDKAHEAEAELTRPHMGTSMLGHKCDRWLWLSFRWAVQSEFSGRMLRLFRRGHREEETIISDLRRIGIDVRDTGAKQSRVEFGCHVSGSVDGVIYSGLPNGHKGRALLECKTHSDKSFNDLAKNGVVKSKPMHWVQMCVYGLGLKIDRALYYAINKNDDTIYTEWLHLDKEVAERAIERGKRIAMSDRMLEPLSTNPSWYECKMCPAYDFCFGSKRTKHVNCRTCASATAKDDGTWRCERHEADGIPVDFQRTGCDDHLIHPNLVPWEAQDGPLANTITYIIDGKPVTNGVPDANIYGSKEILANPMACANPDEFITECRTEMGGRIEG